MDIVYSKKISQEFFNSKFGHDDELPYRKITKKLSKISDVKQNYCYICGGKKTKKEFSFFEINYLRCLKCSHVYTNKRLSEKALNKFYREDKIEAGSIYANKKMLNLREEIIRPKIQFIKKFAKGKNWLDIGSADGSVVDVSISEGFYTRGIEISKKSRAFAKKFRNIDLYPKPLESFALDNNKKWNVISYFGVLEHLADPMKSLKISYNLLVKNGIIAIEVPNYDSVSTYVQKLSTVYDRHLDFHTHIMMFTLKSLKFAIKKAGFKHIATWIWGMDIIELLKYLNRLDKKFANSELSMILSNKINEFQAIFDKEKQGDSILMIAKK